LIVAAKSTETLPYEVPPARWGDSTQVGIGDPVVVAGFPHGRDMFLLTKTNRGLIQPTFHSGLVSAIIPAMNATETRLFQLSVPSAGGTSGGAVFNPNTGEIIGMVFQGLQIRIQGTDKGTEASDIPLPISYAIPSEIIAPYLEVITFQTADRPSEGA
jgi:S1-C subfamily serine protease